ncbi:MAG: ABC transporter substrate-binding protein [Muribaculaceae bacterium]|nr:ABC transporter substrate-binding protein [Muribaculaceae bacterium]
MNKKSIIWAVLAIAVLVGIMCWHKYQPSANNNSETVKIGVLLPLTGAGDIYGKDLKSGIDLAYQESPIKDRIQLVYEDDATDVTKGINAFNSLIFKDVDIVIGGIMSNVASGILPIANKNHVLLFSPKATAVDLSKENDYFFRIWPTDDLDGKYSAAYVVDNLNLKRIAILYDDGTYGVGIRNEFKKYLNGKDVEVVFDEGYSSGQTNFRTQISKIKSSKPDVLFLPAYYKEAVLILKQLNENNCDFYISGVSSFLESEVKQAAGKLTNKVFFTYPLYSVDSSNPSTEYFNVQYDAAYKDRKPNAFSAHGYDSFKVLERVIMSLEKENKEVNATNMKTALEAMDVYHGATGDLRFDKNGDADKGLQILWLKEVNL